MNTQMYAIKITKDTIPLILNTSEQTGVTTHDTDVMQEFLDRDRVFVSYIFTYNSDEQTDDNKLSTWGTMDLSHLTKTFEGDLTDMETRFVLVVRKS